MSRSKLEAMVGWLAGREVDPTLLDELSDPSSESSRFLEATRLRSRALLGQPPLERSPPSSTPIGRAWPWRPALTTVIVLAGFASTAWWIDGRLKTLEVDLDQRDRDFRREIGRVASGLAKLAEAASAPGRLGLLEASSGRIEAELDRIDRKTTREDFEPILLILAELRREMSAKEKGETRRAEEFQASTQETARLLRLLLNRSDPSPTSTDPPTTEPRRKPN